MELEVEDGHGVALPLGVRVRDPVERALEPVVVGIRLPVLLAGHRREDPRVLRPIPAVDRRLGDRHHHRGTDRIVCRRREPCVLMGREDDLPLGVPRAGDLSDRLVAGGIDEVLRLERDVAAHVAGTQGSDELLGRPLADDHHGRAEGGAAFPIVASQGSTLARRVPRMSGSRRDDDRLRSVELGFVGDVVGPDAAPVVIPPRECDLALHILALVLGGSAVPDANDLAGDAPVPGARHASERGPRERPIETRTLGVDGGALEQPSVTGELFHRDVLESDRIHLVGEVVGRLTVLRGAEHTEAERRGADRPQSTGDLLDVAHVELRQQIPSGRGVPNRDRDDRRERDRGRQHTHGRLPDLRHPALLPTVPTSDSQQRQARERTVCRSLSRRQAGARHRGTSVAQPCHTEHARRARERGDEPCPPP